MSDDAMRMLADAAQKYGGVDPTDENAVVEFLERNQDKIPIEEAERIVAAMQQRSAPLEAPTHPSVQDFIRAVERVLGRGLRDDELARANSLLQLSPAARAVATLLARKQLVLCAHYLRWVAPASLADITRYIDDVLLAGCASPCTCMRFPNLDDARRDAEELRSEESKEHR